MKNLFTLVALLTITNQLSVCNNSATECTQQSLDSIQKAYEQAILTGNTSKADELFALGANPNNKSMYYELCVSLLYRLIVIESPHTFEALNKNKAKLCLTGVTTLLKHGANPNIDRHIIEAREVNSVFKIEGTDTSLLGLVTAQFVNTISDKSPFFVQLAHALIDAGANPLSKDVFDNQTMSPLKILMGEFDTSKYSDLLTKYIAAAKRLDPSFDINKI